MDDPLPHLSLDRIRHELFGFPEASVEAALALKASPGSLQLRRTVLILLEFYLPSASEIQLLDLPDDTRLREDVGIDSLTFTEAAFKLEELFDLRIENAELAALTTIKDLSEFIENKIQAR